VKRGLREILLEKRNNIAPEQKELKELAIKKRLFNVVDFKKANNILFYASFRSEVDTIACIQDALRMNKKVALPVVNIKHKTLELFEIKDLSELAPGYMGIPEPIIRKRRRMVLADFDIAIVPGIGFDVTGNRLGYGAGYYDRLLSNSKDHFITIALAFEEQIVPHIPKEIHDVQVDKIITEKRVINCQTKRRQRFKQKRGGTKKIAKANGVRHG